jgi:hypothetical protein
MQDDLSQLALSDPPGIDGIDFLAPESWESFGEPKTLNQQMFEESQMNGWLFAKFEVSKTAQPVIEPVKAGPKTWIGMSNPPLPPPLSFRDRVEAMVDSLLGQCFLGLGLLMQTLLSTPSERSAGADKTIVPARVLFSVDLVRKDEMILYLKDRGLPTQYVRVDKIPGKPDEYVFSAAQGKTKWALRLIRESSAVPTFDKNRNLYVITLPKHKVF